ncbi:MAG: hypothetical protein ACR2N9_11490 [Acidimicrobiia bacterium]
MHYGRILALVGVVLAIVGFLMQSASSSAADLMPTLNEATGGQIPVGFDNTWTALYNDTAWAAVVFGLAMVGAAIVAFIPPLPKPMARIYGLTAAVLGVLMLVIGVFATMGAMDDADTLEAAFNQLFQAGQLPEAFSVDIGFGWYLLPIAGVLVAIGGVVSLINRPDEDAISAS